MLRKWIRRIVDEAVAKEREARKESATNEMVARDKKIDSEIGILRRRIDTIERSVKRADSSDKETHNALMQGPHGNLLNRR